MCVCVCVAESLCCTIETNSTLQIICISIKMLRKKKFQFGCAEQKCGHPVLPDVKFFICSNDLSHCLISEKSQRMLFLKSPHILTPGRYNKAMSCSCFLNESVWHEMLNFIFCCDLPLTSLSPARILGIVATCSLVLLLLHRLAGTCPSQPLPNPRKKFHFRGTGIKAQCQVLEIALFSHVQCCEARN